METVFEIDGPGIKKPYQLKNNIFIIYLPRTITIDTVSSIKIDRNMILHQNSEDKKFTKLTNKKASCGSKY